MKTQSKTTTKRKTSKKEELQPKRSLRIGYILSLPFRIMFVPFYAIYMLLFEVPSVPSVLLGTFRFFSFLFIMLNTSSIAFQNWAENIVLNYGVSHELFNGIKAIYALIMLFNLFLSVLEICGFHDPSKSGYYYNDIELNSNSDYDSFDKALEYRDSLLKTKHTPDKIEELKKTGFITRERLFGIGQSKEVSEALELANAKMRAMHTPDKYKFLQGLFGAK